MERFKIEDEDRSCSYDEIDPSTLYSILQNVDDLYSIVKHEISEGILNKDNCSDSSSKVSSNNVTDVVHSHSNNGINNTVYQPIIIEPPAVKVDDQRIRSVIDLTNGDAVEVTIKKEVIVIDEDSEVNNSSVAIMNNEERKYGNNVSTSKTCSYIEVGSHNPVVSKVEEIIVIDNDAEVHKPSENEQKVPEKCATRTYINAVSEVEDGELNSNEDDDITEVPLQSYSENLVKYSKVVFAQENRHIIMDFAKMITNTFTDVVQKENIDYFTKIVKDESRKQLKKLYKETKKVNKKNLAGIHDSISQSSVDLKEINKSNFKKKYHRKSKKSHKNVKNRKKHLQVRSISESSLSSSTSCDRLPKQYQTKTKSRTSSSSHSGSKRKSRYSLSPRRRYSSRSSSESRSSHCRECSPDRSYNYKSKYPKVSESSNSDNEHGNGKVMLPKASKKRKYSFSSSSSESFPKYNKSRCRRSSSSSPTRVDYSKQRASSKTSRPTTSTSSVVVQEDTFQENLVQGNNIFKRQTTITTTYKEAVLTKEHIGNESDNEESLFSLQQLSLSVYNDNDEDVSSKRPGGDINHTFYIDPKVAELYQVKTRNGVLPVQALHEICTKCYWSLPTYLILPSDNGFRFGMILNNHRFITSAVATKKKKAKEETCKVVLQWLGIIDIP